MSPVATAIVLAGGGSERFGDDPVKQLALFRGEALVHRAVRTALASRVSAVVLVTGHQGDAVTAAVADLAGERLAVEHNEHWRDGQSTSVRSGLRAARSAAPPPGLGGAVFVPCDQPLLTPAVIDALIARWSADRPPAAVPVAGAGIHRRRGAPVLFDSQCFDRLMELSGDTGGRALLGRLGDAVAEVAIDDPRALRDVDTPAVLLELETARAG